MWDIGTLPGCLLTKSPMTTNEAATAAAAATMNRFSGSGRSYLSPNP